MTGAAELRFYAELNDLLASDRRDRDITYPFDVAPSVKDAIEALGVPHTEVDLVLANGHPVDFGYRLADGDRISVYPTFMTIDVSRTSRVRPQPPRELRFVADAHVGTLARYLRLLGFDTRFDPSLTDKALASISAKEERVLISRDRGLLKRSAVRHGVFVRDDEPRRQLVDLARRLDLWDRAAPFTRCMACNGLLDPVDKATIADRLEAGTRRHHDVFRRCTRCGRIFWAGSHHPHLLELIEEVRGAASRE